mmetsp:Transcript_1899/g.3566  ORF Transcript_1899/g.3566 Transcript_1899/m.3566 type:complete len:93 (-) Transcript_1899:451-729(-)
MTQDKGCPQATNALVQPQAPEAQSEDSEAGSLPRAMRAAMPLTGSSGQELPLHIRTRSHSWQPAVQGNGVGGCTQLWMQAAYHRPLPYNGPC